MIAEVQQHRRDIEELCRRYHVERLELFGSAATGDFRSESSDLDFLVEFQGRGEPGGPSRYFGLLQDLEKLFGRSVDLVTISAIKNPYFRESVARTKQPLVGTASVLARLPARTDAGGLRSASVPLEAQKYLYDIQQAGIDILAFTDGRTWPDYTIDRMLRAAVEREFQIIGEALAQLARREPETAARISDYPQIISFRNVLVHRYGDVKDEDVWRTIVDDLPRLLAEVEPLLDR